MQERSCQAINPPLDHTSSLLSLVRYFRYHDSETLPKSNQRIWTQSC